MLGAAGASCPRVRNARYAVWYGITKPAASTAASASGAGYVDASSASAKSAKPPQPRKNAVTPITRSPTRASQPSPTASTRPATSWPGVNGSSGRNA